MTSFEQLTQLLQKRILIIDGAMGTMIQQHSLEESDFRGEQSPDLAYHSLLCNHQHDIRGNNDVWGRGW